MTMSLKLGAHLSVAGGYTNALEKTIQIGGNCLQIFSASPRQWKLATPSDEHMQEFVWLKEKLKIDPVYFHASYLINLADPGRVGELSVQTLINELQIASKMQISGTIIHLGSFKDSLQSPVISHQSSSLRASSDARQSLQIVGSYNQSYETLITNIQTILSNTPENTYFIIEDAGNRKIGMILEEIARIINDLDNDRVRVCLDTCHMYAAGYDISTPEKFDQFFKKLNQLIGLDKLEVFQVNDSKDPLGSYRDRHENIGEGTIGLETFKLLLIDPRTKNKPFILEVPGFEKKGPDRSNILLLRQLY